MAESKFPEKIQDVIKKYERILSLRFPPPINYYRISTGYNRPTDALNDTTPLTVIYTTDNTEPVVDSTIYIDRAKNDIFNGNGQYYNLFDSSGRPLVIVIQISKSGVVMAQGIEYPPVAGE